jgi:fructose-bisphosphate aldolase, class II
MLVKPHEMFDKALNYQFAIGAFNTSNLEVSQAIVWAAEEKQSPVIVQTSEGAIEYAGLSHISAIVKSLAEEASVPVILHLDHGKSFDMVQQCIEAGYTSVMIDVSIKSLSDNIALTKEVVSYAHDRGVWVEAELGAILGAEGARGLGGEKTPDELFTQPDQVKKFVEETEVDALAVSVGTIHGAFTGQEYIRFELLATIEKTVPTLPLVLHGASGIPDDHLRRAAEQNVCKVNVDTETRIAFEDAVRAYFEIKHDKVDPRKILEPAREAVQAVVEAKIDLFGSTLKARVQ